MARSVGATVGFINGMPVIVSLAWGSVLITSLTTVQSSKVAKTFRLPLTAILLLVDILYPESVTLTTNPDQSSAIPASTFRPVSSLMVIVLWVVMLAMG